MTLENQDFDKRLVELNSKAKEILKEIEVVEKEKMNYIQNTQNKRRKDFLLQNSVELKNVKLEKIDGVYFVIAQDDTFEYVVRMTKDQAEELADDLDDELAKDLTETENQDSPVHQLFAPLFQNMKLA